MSSGIGFSLASFPGATIKHPGKPTDLQEEGFILVQGFRFPPLLGVLCGTNIRVGACGGTIPVHLWAHAKRRV